MTVMTATREDRTCGYVYTTGEVCDYVFKDGEDHFSQDHEEYAQTHRSLPGRKAT